MSNDPRESAFQIPCLACGAMPEASWEDADWLICANDECKQRIFAIHFTSWPAELTMSEKRDAWKASEI